MSTEPTTPDPEDFDKLGISCSSGREAVNVTLETSSLPSPNGKHRWSYRCKDPDTGDLSEKDYTEWIYD